MEIFISVIIAMLSGLFMVALSHPKIFKEIVIGIRAVLFIGAMGLPIFSAGILYGKTLAEGDDPTKLFGIDILGMAAVLFGAFAWVQFCDFISKLSLKNNLKKTEDKPDESKPDEN